MKKVTFLPYPAAINLPPQTPIIAIGNPGQVYKYQQEYVHKLDVRFSDEVLKEGDATFTIEQAEQILAFVNALPEHSMLVVHCGQGIIRSPAIAKALSDHGDYTLEICYPGCLKSDIIMDRRAYYLMSEAIMEEISSALDPS